MTTIPSVISWPLFGISNEGTLDYAKDDQSVREVMRNILLTNPGERLMRPEFGAGLLEFIHQPNNETTRNLIANVVSKALSQWETRVVVDQVQVTPEPKSLTDIQIMIYYHMRHSNKPELFSLSMNLSV